MSFGGFLEGCYIFKKWSYWDIVFYFCMFIGYYIYVMEEE